MPPSKARFATLTSWSFSVYVQYLKCPFSVCLDKIMRVRIVEPPNPHFEKGTRIHGNAEKCIATTAGRMPKLEPEFEKQPKLKEMITRFRKAKAKVELEWAFDRQYNVVDWRDWTKAWLRIKTDVCADTVDPPTVDIVDWKTGKTYEEHKQQRSLYALGGLQLVQLGVLAGGSKDTQLTARHVYVDTGLEATEEFTMKNLAPLKREWAARIKQMMSDTVYKTHIGHHCKYCKYAKSRGGPCPEKM